MPQWILVVAVPIAVLVLLPFIVAGFLRDVDAGTIRMVSWLNGSTVIYRGPGKSKEIPLLTTGTTLSSKVINVDLDITDQTADVEESGTPRPIKVRVLASAIVSVGDSDTMIKTAANRFFAKSDEEQISTLTDLLTSSGRRAINLLTHDQLFSAKSSARGPRTNLPAVASAPPTALVEAEDDDDPLAIIIRKACSRELTDPACCSIRSTSRSCSPRSRKHGGVNPPRRRRRMPTSSPRSRPAEPRRPSSTRSGRSPTSSGSWSKPRHRMRPWWPRRKRSGRKRWGYSASPSSTPRRSPKRRRMRRRCGSTSKRRLGRKDYGLRRSPRQRRKASVGSTRQSRREGSPIFATAKSKCYRRSSR